MDNRIVRPGPVPGHNPHAQALQACISEALSEAPGLATRWVAGLADVLKQQEAWAPNPRERASLGNAIKLLAQHKHRFETEWAAHWGRAITDALHHRSEGPAVRRSLANISFDDLELMDDTQIQATVQVARLEQAVQGAAGDTLTDLSALLSRVQGFTSVKADHNPLRPDVAIAALRQTMESLTTDKGARTLWLQQGTPILGQELQVLYRHLIRLLETHGVTPVGFNVVQAPSNATGGKAGGAYVQRRPDGVADRLEAEFEPTQPIALPVEGAGPPSDLLTLNHLHQLLVNGSPDTRVTEEAPTPVVADPWTTIVPRSIPLAAGVPAGEFPILLPELSDRLPTALPRASAPTHEMGYRGPDRRSRRAGDAAPRDDAAEHLKALASEVVQLMLDGMARDPRLLPPVRDMLQQLKPALLRIAHEDPRFFADKLNPARRLLDEVTQRSLAFENVGSRGLAHFLGTLDDVAQLFLRADVDVSTLFETALEVLAPEEVASEGETETQTRGRAVATLVKAEQRFLLAEKVADEVARRPDFAKANPQVQQFVQGPWAQVIAQARLEPATHLPPGRLAPDLRYLGLLSDLLWSSRVDMASRNRGRLARLIPGLLRTLREGLQTIDYDPAASRQFFTTIMALHEAGLKVDGEREPPAITVPHLVLPAEERASGGAVSAHGQPWMRPSEAADTGFMAEPFPELNPDDFADTLPQFDTGTGEPGTHALPALGVGAWVSLQKDDGPWQRLQLAWSSPHGTMYLFNGPSGQTISMSHRSFDKLWRAGRLTLVAAHSVVDDALDSVVDVAVLNSARAPAAPDEDTEYPDLLPPLG
jgi:hypothetical protein